MRIADWMAHSVHTVKPLDSIEHARHVMTRERVNQLPVVHGTRLVGIITDRDLRDAFPSVFDLVDLEIEGARPPGHPRPRHSATDPKKVTVDLVMTLEPLTLGPADTVDEAARMMRAKRIGAVPIQEGSRLVGILTRSDVLAAFMTLANESEKAVRP